MLTNGNRGRCGGRQIIISLSYFARATQKKSMFNMVFWWPWGLFGCPVGRHVLSIHYIARKYVCVHSTMGRPKAIKE